MDDMLLRAQVQIGKISADFLGKILGAAKRPIDEIDEADERASWDLDEMYDYESRSDADPGM